MRFSKVFPVAFAVFALASGYAFAGKGQEDCKSYNKWEEGRIATGSAQYRSGEKLVDSGNVSKDFRSLLVRITEIDPVYRSFRVGDVKVKVSFSLRPNDELPVEMEVAGHVEGATFQFADSSKPAREAGHVIVCGNQDKGFTIAIDEKLIQHRPFLTKIATQFLKSDKIVVAGTKIWPREDSQQ
ncbi:hypothetical protein [Kumtagia ephedrae]|uniref:Uncharacterized protein n=1 Tax=Kumtagia ephedrae TaxID=2116701 RepID=A0A2P7S857_9HYPH|nr:hypothetical protein [Mesorhizobium ephedrae]PSJ58673.1 hypothetical protein C7I84_14385 [Mesorhizobium ephedrae]